MVCFVLLASPEMTAERIANVREILEHALSGGTPRAEVEEQLEAAGSGFSDLLNYAERSGGLAGWLSVLLAIIALVYQIASTSGSVGEADVERIVNQKLEQSMPSAPPRASFAARPYKLRLPSREADPTQAPPSQNSRCSCGSGKKFKHCHGTKRWT
jgi:uncharacterized protein YecA (UPF0149 family)